MKQKVEMMLILSVFLLAKIEGYHQNNKPISTNHKPMFYHVENRKWVYNDDYGNLDMEDGTVVATCGKSKIQVPYLTKFTGKYQDKKYKTPYGEEVGLEELSCSDSITTSGRDTCEGCAGNKGKLYQIGFDLEFGFSSLIDVCFNEYMELPLYTHHTIKGKYVKFFKWGEIKGASGSTRPNYRRKKRTELKCIQGNYRRNFAFYKNENYKKVLAELSIDITGQELIRGHLTPVRDMCEPIGDDAPNYYINTVPQWKSNNNGNWQKIETETKIYAGEIKKDLKVWTGVCGIFEREKKPVFLKNGDKIPIPQYLWKAVCSEDLRECVGFITINDFIDTKTKSKIQGCSEDCTQWFKCDNVANVHNQVGSGKTYCCSVANMKGAMESKDKNCELPALLDSTTLLRYN